MPSKRPAARAWECRQPPRKEGSGATGPETIGLLKCVYSYLRPRTYARAHGRGVRLTEVQRLSSVAVGRAVRWGLSVHIFSVPNLEDCDLVSPVINEINDPILSLTHAVAIGVARKLF